MVVMSGITAVFVNGFDFGTTKGQLESHCNEVGTVKSVAMKMGSAVVTFSSSAEATTAVATLNKSTIEGNSRFIDVSLDKKSFPPKWGVKRSAGGSGGSCRVFVRGFDFGTTDEQFEGHMSSAGNIENVTWVNKGAAEVIYSSADEAAAAVEQLQGTTIEGNTRFIDVHAREFETDAERPAKRFNTGGGGEWVFMPTFGGGKGRFGGGKGFGGGKSWGKGVFGGGKGKGFGGGKSWGKAGDHKDEDPVGSGRVFVRGFDFGTDNDQFEAHMSRAGPIHTVHWVTKGSAVVVYKRQASAVNASSQLDQTTIQGNSRYIDIILKD